MNEEDKKTTLSGTFEHSWERILTRTKLIVSLIPMVDGCYLTRGKHYKKVTFHSPALFISVKSVFFGKDHY